VRRALVAAVIVPTLAVGPAAHATPAHPSLEVRTLHPFKVQGREFRPAERIRVSLVVSEGQIRHVRRVTANKSGAFVASFLGVQIGRCDAFVVAVRGNRGSKATLKRREVPADCPGPSFGP